MTRCPAAHPEDPDGCVGPVTVTVQDTQGSGLAGCGHHAARLLASLDGGSVYPLPDTPAGAALRVHQAADGIRPFPWHTTAPRVRADQLSRAEARSVRPLVSAPHPLPGGSCGRSRASA